MTPFGLLEALILLAVAIYVLRMLITDIRTQRIVIGLIALVFLLWLLESFAVFGPSFHRPMFR